ncbi:MAG: hypothetical protein M3P84_13020, partial [Chloroflexota bacterium]|nr:hypothetical protein [Chloroflexota bacterium]
MSLRLRALVPVLLIALVVVGGVALSGGLGIGAGPGANPSAVTGNPDGSLDPFATDAPTIPPLPTPRPALGGTELFGYLPYWQMTNTMATYLRSTPLTTLALFSVTARRGGLLNTSASGYKRITGDIGRRLIDEAHARDARVELVFTSFGAERNG